MLNVCEPCLMVITRCPRRCSSAASRTVSVVLPLCFLPITATIGGCRMCLREDPFLGCVDVHEDKSRLTIPRHLLGRNSRETDIVIKRDHPPVAARDATLDRARTRWRIVRAQRLQTTARIALGDGRIGRC